MNNTSDIQDRYVFTYVSLINIQRWEITEMMLPYCISKFWFSNEQKYKTKLYILTFRYLMLIHLPTS